MRIKSLGDCRGTPFTCLSLLLVGLSDNCICIVTRHGMYNMQLYILITRLIVIDIAPSTVLFSDCLLADLSLPPLLKDIGFNAKCLLVWCD